VRVRARGDEEHDGAFYGCSFRLGMVDQGHRRLRE